MLHMAWRAGARARRPLRAAALCAECANRVAERPPWRSGQDTLRRRSARCTRSATVRAGRVLPAVTVDSDSRPIRPPPPLAFFGERIRTPARASLGRLVSRAAGARMRLLPLRVHARGQVVSRLVLKDLVQLHRPRRRPLSAVDDLHANTEGACEMRF